MYANSILYKKSEMENGGHNNKFKIYCKIIAIYKLILLS